MQSQSTTLCACGCGGALTFGHFSSPTKRFRQGHHVRLKQPRHLPRIPIADRFWAKVDKNGPIPAHRPELGPCWVWTAGKTHDGYGSIGKGGRGNGNMPTHVVAWELAHGPVPDGALVCHACDNRPCVRQDHLFLGTHADNTRDMHSKGRYGRPRALGDANVSRRHPEKFRGERNGNARLTDDQVREIRRRYAAGETQTALGREYGVNQTMIGFIVRRTNWAHVV